MKMNQEYTDYYESNLKLLEKYHLQTFKQITEKSIEPLGNVFFSANGKPNLIVMSKHGNSVVLHEETDPEKDIDMFVKRIPEEHQGFVGILGIGLGYGIAKILKERPLLQRLALFDLEPGIFIQAIRYMDFSEIFTDPRVILRIGSDTPINEALYRAHTTIRLEDANIIHHLPSLNSNLDGYNELKTELFSHLNVLNIEGTTTKLLGKDFINNRFQHISIIHHHRIIDQVENIFPGKPAILVAGGPSLDKNIHLLKQIQDKAVIIAADTVLPALLNNGVSPHFLTSIDPNNITFEKFADIVSNARDISLICASSVNLKTAKIFPADQVFWTFAAKPVESWLNGLLGGKVSTSGASTVAHLNLITAKILGCDPIVFIGQDLAYPGTTSHATGTVLHGTAPSHTNGQKTEATMTMGVNGKMVRTDRGFLSMKSHFEDMIRNTQREYINATEGGAHIEGTRISTLQDVINTYCTETIYTGQFLKRHYETIPPLATENIPKAFKKLLETIQTINKKIKQADTITRSLLKGLITLKKNRKLIKSFNMLSSSQQQQVRKIDRFHSDLDNTGIIWHILEEVTRDGLKESERQKLAIAALEKKPSRYLDWLIQNLYRLMEINKVRKQASDLLADNLEMVLSFHEKEQLYRENIHRGIKKTENILNLVRLYVDSKNYYLAKPFLEELHQSMPESGEVYFLLGCTALQFNEHTDAKQYFENAVKHRPDIAGAVEKYRKTLGDEFFSFVQHFKMLPNRDASIKYTLRKGLLFCPSHKDLKKELENFLNTDLEKIKSLIDGNDYPAAAPLINEWHDHIIENNHMFGCISQELLKEIFLYHGKLKLSLQNYTMAIQSFKTALELSPGDSDLYFLIIDTYFVSEDFHGAIEAINHAITIDVKFAGYWETIGDQLREGGQHEDAITAYEKCFMYLPDKIGLIKKIGDCYMASGHLEAAKTAYEILKQKLEQMNPPDVTES